MHGPVPLRSTPMAVALEPTVENSHNQEPNQEPAATSEDHSNGQAMQIISETGVLCLNKGMPLILSIWSFDKFLDNV